MKELYKHEFTHNPIKIRLLHAKTLALKNIFVFIGEVPKSVQNDLKKASQVFNKYGTIFPSKVLKKFYGTNWPIKLGLKQQMSNIYKVTGGGSMPLDFTLDEHDMNLIEGLDLVSLDDIPHELDTKQSQTIDTKQSQTIDTKQSQHDIVVHSKSAQKIKLLNFIFDIQIFPVDSVEILKKKISIITDIPIYRQHLYHKYHNKTLPLQYTVKYFDTNVNINYETMKKDNVVNDIPLDIKFYENKDAINVYSRDQFTIIATLYNSYGVSEFNLIDISDMIPENINSKLKTRYQIELVYYSYVILYFPMMSLQVFMQYLKNSNEIYNFYPDFIIKKSIIDLQDKLTAQSYHFVEKPILKHLHSSITKTIVSILKVQDKEAVLVLRNIFDVLVLTDTITYCKANLLHENRHVILKKAYLNEKEPKDPLPINSIMIKVKTNADTNENMRLIMFNNGNYVIRTDWREENQMSFKDILKSLIANINPIIKLINNMGDRVKNYARNIEEINKNNIQFTETNYTFFYDVEITDLQFKIIKKILNEYEKAHIILSKESVGLDKEYFFMKGMYNFDVKRLDKVITIQNYYEYLSNSAVKQKWNSLFNRTRLFSISNISSKLKINISGIRDDTESYFFHMYLNALLHLYHKNTNKTPDINIKDKLANRTKKRLKALKIQDPLLYDFKKIYKSNVIYSKICQKPYQPIMLDEKEYKKLPKQRKERAVKYWNFTKEKPVYYSCTNQKYPYIKFIVKQHPRDFCIPCCKKIPMSEAVNIKRRKIHELCLTKHKYTGKKTLITKGSHYIATYGKSIEVGRLARLPEHTLEPLFFNTYSHQGVESIDQECITQEGYYMFGVDQNTANVNNIGYLYCIVHALKTNVDEFIKSTVEKIRNNKTRYKILMNGGINYYFKDVDDFCNKFMLINTDTFIEKSAIIPWNKIIQSIGYYYFGINTILFEDKQKERIRLVLPRGIKTSSDMFTSNHRNLVVMNKHDEYYPIYLLNSEVFKKTGLIESRLFFNDAGIMITIRAIVDKYLKSNNHKKIYSTITLNIVEKFINTLLKTKTKTKIIGYWINNANLCYAVNISHGNTTIYFPIEPSHYQINDDIELLFKPFKEPLASIGATMELCKEFNKWNARVSKKENIGSVLVYPELMPNYWIKYHNDIIGFVCNHVNWYTKKFNKATALRIAKVPIQRIMYNPLLINNLIANYKSNGVKPKRALKYEQNYKRLQLSLYNYHLYDLLMLKFTEIFNKQRNTKLRGRLLRIIAKENLDKTTTNISEFIAENIQAVEDKKKINTAIGRYLSIHHNKKTLIQEITNGYYLFDRVNLERIKKLTYREALKEIKQIAKEFIQIGKINQKGFVFPNILVSCGKNTRSSSKQSDIPQYCSNGKFILTREQYNDIFSIIAYDITNPSKFKWLFSGSFVEKSIDFFKFIKRPMETITILFI